MLVNLSRRRESASATYRWSWSHPRIGSPHLHRTRLVYRYHVKVGPHSCQRLTVRYPAHFEPTSTATIDQWVSTAKSAFLTDKTKSYEWRSTQLKKFFEGLDQNTEAFQDALAADFGKPRHEVLLTELQTLKGEIIEVLGHLKSWMKPEAGAPAFPFNLTFPKIHKEPLGVALIIGAWNYPLFVTFGPLIGAIAAGCPAILKPSELAPHCAVVMAAVIHKHLDSECYKVVQGAIPETTHLLNKQKFDTIFYTGGGAVARIIAAAAAKNLTPVTLELGGKNAAVITKNADLKLAARRIAWGKVTNAGQTCVAPDYILFTEPGLEEKFTQEFRNQIEEMYPGEAYNTPGTFTRIVNSNHFERIKKLIDSTKGKVVVGGKTDASQRLITPTLVAGVQPDDSLMSQEIFGPVIPMLHEQSLDSAIKFLQQRDKSLALYIFTTDSSEPEKLFNSVSSGGAMVNDVMTQCALTALPFGGVGESGTGSHNGRAGFDAFTHRRTVVNNPAWFEHLISIRYAPYTPSKISTFKMMAPKAYWDKNYKDPSRLLKLFKFGLSLSLLFAAFKFIRAKL